MFQQQQPIYNAPAVSAAPAGDEGPLEVFDPPNRFMGDVWVVGLAD
jgi:hypothetical protein